MSPDVLSSAHVPGAIDCARVAKALGFAYAANTAAIVFGQLVTLRLIKGRRRSSMLGLCAATWSVAWVVIAGYAMYLRSRKRGARQRLASVERQ